MGRPKNKPFSKLSEIPSHVFRNKVMTSPIGDEFIEYLKYMLDNHEQDLHYIYRRMQRYKDIPGAAQHIPFDRWLLQLRNGIKKIERNK